MAKQNPSRASSNGAAGQGAEPATRAAAARASSQCLWYASLNFRPILKRIDRSTRCQLLANSYLRPRLQRRGRTIGAPSIAQCTQACSPPPRAPASPPRTRPTRPRPPAGRHPQPDVALEDVKRSPAGEQRTCSAPRAVLPARRPAALLRRAAPPLHAARRVDGAGRAARRVRRPPRAAAGARRAERLVVALVALEALVRRREAAAVAVQGSRAPHPERVDGGRLLRVLVERDVGQPVKLEVRAPAQIGTRLRNTRGALRNFAAILSGSFCTACTLHRWPNARSAPTSSSLRSRRAATACRRCCTCRSPRRSTTSTASRCARRRARSTSWCRSSSSAPAREFYDLGGDPRVRRVEWVGTDLQSDAAEAVGAQRERDGSRLPPMRRRRTVPTTRTTRPRMRRRRARRRSFSSTRRAPWAAASTTATRCRTRQPPRRRHEVGAVGDGGLGPSSRSRTRG